MILGIGTDIIEINRIDNAVNRTSSFLEKSFTKREIEYFEKRKMRAEVIAGNFAAKEAISKALGTGFRGFGLIDIEVLRNEIGKPIVNLSNNIYEKINRKDFKIQVSISHNNENAIAFAIMEGKE